MTISSPEDLKALAERGRAELYPAVPKVVVGTGSCGLAAGAGDVLAAVREHVQAGGPEAIVAETGCLGLCQREPLVDVVRPGMPRITYADVDEKAARALVDSLRNGVLLADRALARMDEDELLVEDAAHRYLANGLPGAARGIPSYSEVGFYAKQRKVVLRNCGFMDPTSLEQYAARGGYRALWRALNEFQPDAIIDEVKRSGLRGRGGGGFLTGRKWESCRRAPGEPKYVLCNADEGDPGAYMDRSVLEGDPHSVLEGMAIAAYAIGAGEGFIYVRAEYPLAVARMQRAIAQAEEAGLLGENIFGTGFSLKLQVNRGGGAFVCGESTALMASVEGRPGEPRAKYIHTVESGVWGKPSNLNNVETYANVPVVLARGADWFAGMGTEGSKGTKVFSLVGKVKNTGLVEVPMGVSLREMVYDVGGGILGDREFKAVQTGGPSGGCIPAEHLDTPVDFDRLWDLGSMMGSGGMIVMDQDTCMVDVARYFVEFLQDESCGKCVPCREGLRHMLRILESICEGRGREGDIDLLEDVGKAVAEGSLCQLGGSAPNPVLSTIKYFRPEYEAHIKENRCPAGVCRALITYAIEAETCTGCMRCVKSCPVGAISGEKKQAHVIDGDKCTKCGACRASCRFGAVTVS